jgi:hypothetical protein
MKSTPLTVTLIPAIPAEAVAGLIDVIDGAEFDEPPPDPLDPLPQPISPRIRKRQIERNGTRRQGMTAQLQDEQSLKGNSAQSYSAAIGNQRENGI